ncbi:hypothetical protein EDB84DRAFT_1679434 [Lactarius hengduanensis]|nr:hypothetical protein EDB84DRAFT_1679434 [Lactarius hengduanensis]
MGGAGVELGAGELDKTFGVIGDGSTRSIDWFLGDETIRLLRLHCKVDQFVSLLGMYAAVSTKSTFFGRSDCLTGSSSHFWIVVAFLSTHEPVINLRYKDHCVDGDVCGGISTRVIYMQGSCSVDGGVKGCQATWRYRTRQRRGERRNGVDRREIERSKRSHNERKVKIEYQEAGKSYEGGEVEVEGVKWRTERWRQELGREAKSRVGTRLGAEGELQVVRLSSVKVMKGKGVEAGC